MELLWIPEIRIPKVRKWPHQTVWEILIMLNILLLLLCLWTMWVWERPSQQTQVLVNLLNTRNCCKTSSMKLYRSEENDNWSQLKKGKVWSSITIFRSMNSWKNPKLKTQFYVQHQHLNLVRILKHHPSLSVHKTHLAMNQIMSTRKLCRGKWREQRMRYLKKDVNV